MVLLVPDDTQEVTEEATDAFAQPKAQLDDSEANKATQKVDLDLDDAPFLEDEDEEEEIVFDEEETPLLDEPIEDSKFDIGTLFKNKLFLISLSVIVILIAIIVFLLLREPEAPPPPPNVDKAQPKEEAPEAVEQTPEILIRLDPFLIEQKDGDGQIRFLEARVVVSTLDDGLARQFKQETYAVRNALYYYLKNKDLQFLSDKENSDKLKSELLAIINQYMGYGQFETLLFEQYLVR